MKTTTTSIDSVVIYISRQHFKKDSAWECIQMPQAVEEHPPFIWDLWFYRREINGRGSPGTDNFWWQYVFDDLEATLFKQLI